MELDGSESYDWPDIGHLWLYLCVSCELLHQCMLTLSTGFDAAAHMSEEIKDAGITVPRAMAESYILNGALRLVFLISCIFMMTDVDVALNDPTYYPHIWVSKASFT